ncbi:hypothetical protein TpMuguga_04g00155 [Theileria parva strain Muguga]|uniref:uncharacterized protein n=1 Tax=Theileria parva strain Muguga TaxID=333668 RepID=UPI001C61C68F|nr:uncharacterized protein TpMuguga_04g00155 [Theileria parva strain Muguga]EAN31507.2 hypothetical protein TpMuguga_04g00155 [Theileria parva strain Muguga]
MRILLLVSTIVLVDCKIFTAPILATLKSKDLPEDATLDYAYMTKNRGNVPKNEPKEVANVEEVEQEGEEPGVKNEIKGNLASNNAQSGTFGENSGNMSNNTNSNNTTTTNNYQTAEKGFKDAVPVGAMQSTPNNNIKNTTDASHHKGDTSTFVTNNFYNPPNKVDNTLTIGGQLEYEYLWKRIYDIDTKLAELHPVMKSDQPGPLKRKGLIITFDPESDPNNKTLSVDSDGIPNNV